jgi:hypothetical protein
VASGASSFGVGGVRLDSDFSVSGSQVDGVLVRRTVSEWGRNLQWNDTSSDVMSNQLDNVVDYNLSGLFPFRTYMVYTNGLLSTTVSNFTDISGNLSITGIDLTATHTMRLEPVPVGTIMMVR